MARLRRQEALELNAWESIIWMLNAELLRRGFNFPLEEPKWRKIPGEASEKVPLPKFKAPIELHKIPPLRETDPERDRLGQLAVLCWMKHMWQRYPFRQCERESCRKIHRKDNKLFCSRRCRKLANDTVANKKKREIERDDKLRRAQEALAKWNPATSRMESKTFVKQETRFSLWFLTHHENLGYLKFPQRPPRTARTR